MSTINSKLPVWFPWDPEYNPHKPNDITLQSLDEFSSDDDSDFDPDDISVSDIASEMSDRDRAEAEAIDEEYFATPSTTFSSRIEGELKKNALAIAAAALCVFSVLYWIGSSSEDQVKELGYKQGLQEGMSQTLHALTVVETFAKQNVTALFTKNLQQSITGEIYVKSICYKI